MQRAKKVVLGIGMIVIAGCATPGRESFTVARDLEQHNRLDEALPLYEEALSQDPTNPDYVASVKGVRRRLASHILEQASAQMKTTPMTYDTLRSAQGYLEKALKKDPENAEARSLGDSLQAQMSEMARNAESAYSDGIKALEKKDWRGAMEKFKGIAVYYPNYPDLTEKITATEKGAVDFFMNEADRYASIDDTEGLIRTLEAAQSFQPGNTQIASLLQDARLRNSSAENIRRAEKEIGEEKWDRVQAHVSKAQRLYPTPQERERIAAIINRASGKMVESIQGDIRRNALYNAYDKFMILLTLNPQATKMEGTDAVRRELLSLLAQKAEALEGSGYIGLSLFWSECGYKLSGNNKDIYLKIQSIKDKIRQRVIKKIAIIDFTSPSSNPDAGRLVTDSLLSDMVRNGSGDVKILARDMPGALGKEVDPGQARLHDIESAKKSGKLRGADVLIFGDVLQYGIEKNVEEGQKTVVAKVGVDREPNPHYAAWMTAHPNPSEQELQFAPPPFIERDKTETIRYKVATHRKIANVVISFRMVDAESGEVVISKTLKSKKEAVGTYSEGVDIAGIPYQRADLPADSDLIEKAVDEAISDLGHQVLTHFQNLQQTYLNSAEALKKKGGFEPVAEKYMDAVMSEEVKNVRTPVTDSARTELDKLLRLVERDYPQVKPDVGKKSDADRKEPEKSSAEPSHVMAGTAVNSQGVGGK